ncbi:hypothetical protein F2Q68_00006633 [Brassica cretica]|uniref:Uncharacterized protein n=1 Tax=Brassica cretica TaxID=69181 RepID=A0A8S9JEX1_BRACR|nr:hypothetical protein F2Q68_00006633 [Brassica cretica]
MAKLSCSYFLVLMIVFSGSFAVKTAPGNTLAALHIVLTILKFPDLLTVVVHIIVKGITL